MSNRLTFSLASLILIFAFAFATMPVMAAPNGPTVTITDNGTTASPSTRSDFKLKFVFSAEVEDFDDNGDAEWRYYDKNDKLLGSSYTSFVPSAVENKPKEYTATINVGNNIPAGAVGFVVRVPENKASTLTVQSLGNQTESQKFALPTLLSSDILASFGTPEKHPTLAKAYTVNLVLTNVSTTNNTTPPSQDSSYAVVTAASIRSNQTGVTIDVGTSIDAATTPPATTTLPLTVTLPTGVDWVRLTLDSSYAVSTTEGGTVIIPTQLPQLAAPFMTVSNGKNAVGNRNNGNIDVSWTWNGNAANLYRFSVNWIPFPSDGDSWTTVFIAKDSLKQYTIPRSALTAGKVYRVDIQAIPLDETTHAMAWSNQERITAQAPVNPAAPTGVVADVDDELNTIEVEWEAVSGLTYEVTRTHMEAGVEETVVYSNLTTSPLSLTAYVELPVESPLPLQGVEYSFTVTATDSDILTSAASTAATATAKIDVEPTVDISTLSHGASSFVVRFTFAEATMMSAPTTADPNAGMALDDTKYDPLPVPTSFPIGALDITTDAAGMNPANIPQVTGDHVTNLNNPNVFDVTINYAGDSLPLYVSLDATADLSAIGIGGGAHTFVPVTPMPALMVTSTKTPTIDIPHATSSSAAIPLGNHTIGAYDFFVLVRDVETSGIYSPGQSSTWVHSEDTALPDLDWFFGTRVVRGIKTNGGTIALNGPATGSVGKKDLVFSEIMWGTDSSMAVPECSQWIEFYNATPNAIDLSGYTIQFHRSQVPSSAWSAALDVVSNVNATSIYFPPSEFPGQSGRSNVRDTQGAIAQQEDLVSMYRHLDEPRIMHHNVAKREERDKGIGGWNASQYPTANIAPIHIATPGAHQIVHTTLTATKPDQRIIINEIGNSSNDMYDWLELYNTTEEPVNIENWELTRVEGTHKNGDKGTEVKIARFPKQVIPAMSYVVIAASNPKNDGNDLAAGIDITKHPFNQVKRGLGDRPEKLDDKPVDQTTAYYLVDTEVKFKNDDNRYLYILRNHHDKKLGTPGHIEDVVGTLSIPARGDLKSTFTGYAAHQRQLWDTATWPLQKWGEVHDDVNQDDGHSGHGHEDFRPGYVYQRAGKNNGISEHNIDVRPYTGIGYDRHAPVNIENGGTPGYDNGAVKSKASDLAGKVTISEIMLAVDENEVAGRVPRATRLPQWIEIYNSSLTNSVNLKNWYIEIQNANSEDLPVTRNLSETLKLTEADVFIQPNQTVLIVSSSGLSSANFPEQRVINLFTTGAYRSALNMKNRGESVLSQVGFWIQLRDADNKVVDTIGNLEVSRRTGVEPARRDNFDTAWDLPDLHSSDGHRSSFIRIYDKGVVRNGLLPVADGSIENGIKNGKFGWISAWKTSFQNVPSLTYYGNHRDYGTPGYRGGGPLPVSLSKFRPERLKETGEVVIRWVTESELNNAGFNILRSDTRGGEYTKLNTQLIAGQGTTSERNTYEWKDTSAKPNVAYYYQIQDVSLDGQVNTLRVNRLKGHINAAGKATTTWGELKALQ